jgi:hypothetical protein
MTRSRENADGARLDAPLASPTFTGVATAPSLVLTPTTAPSSPSEGELYYNNADNLVYIYVGSKWEMVNGTDASATGTGGTIRNHGSYRSHTFLQGDKPEFVLFTAKTVDILMVGGGGGAGTYNVTVGYTGGDSGKDTLLMGGTTPSTQIQLKAFGGGGGGKGNGKNGGSGGGGGHQISNQGYAGGTGASGQGNNGGTGTAGLQAGGGGGGAGVAGTNGASTVAGNGGNGLQNDYQTGSNIYYAGGGAGGTTYSSTNGGCVGGLGGGGQSYPTGGSQNLSGENGVDGLGGGGGGGEHWGTGEGGGGAGGMLVIQKSLSVGSYLVTIGSGGPGGGSQASAFDFEADPTKNGGANQGGNGGSGIIVLRYSV